MGGETQTSPYENFEVTRSMPSESGLDFVGRGADEGPDFEVQLEGYSSRPYLPFKGVTASVLLIWIRKS